MINRKMNPILEGLTTSRKLRSIKESASDVDMLISQILSIYASGCCKKPVNLESNLKVVSDAFHAVENYLIQAQDTAEYQHKTDLIKRSYTQISKVSNLLDGIVKDAMGVECSTGLGNEVDTGDQNLGTTLGRAGSNSGGPQWDKKDMQGVCMGEMENPACDMLCSLRDLAKNITTSLAENL